MTSRQPCWCSKTKEWRPWWCTKLILRELNSIFMQILSFVSVIKYGRWSRVWKRSIVLHSVLLPLSMRKCLLFVFLGEQLGRFTQSTRGVFTKSYLPLSSQSQSGACHDHHFGYGQAHTQIAHAAFSISMATRSRHGARDSPDVWRHVQHSQGLQRVFAISFYR